MGGQTTFMSIGLIISAVIILSVFVKSRHFFRCLFLSSLSGIGSLFAVNVLSQMTGITLGINAITLSVSALGGIPSVIAMLAARYFMLT
ncbi:MAG: pro-sigmaK processing inhibitor BofA family protein [Clostridia bacterium]|nr:pro-sigmaK processing inhibitor BofA family protein [Clostridia bacterium]